MANYVLWRGETSATGNNSFGGVDMVISGNVPQGAGLGSSASLEARVGTVLQQLYHLPLDGAQIALNGQEAENQFVEAVTVESWINRFPRRQERSMPC